MLQQRNQYPMNQNQQYKVNKIMEGLRRHDLKDMVDPRFTVDQYQSKMGNDSDIIVLRFRAKNKEPAIDLMEFIERGYPFVLDADRSSGEERDGYYSIFVELERTANAPKQVESLINGISQLCDQTMWRFRWYKDTHSFDFSVDSFMENVPLTPEEYETRMHTSEELEVSEFFDQGAIDSISVNEHKKITFTKPFAESLSAKFVAIGEYELLKNALKGPLQLDESSRNQIMYLNKYLGNYDINKIEGHFLIRNGEKAVILAKENW